MTVYEARSRQKRVCVCVCGGRGSCTCVQVSLEARKGHGLEAVVLVFVRGSCEPTGVALGTKLCVLQNPMWKGKRKPATSPETGMNLL